MLMYIVILQNNMKENLNMETIDNSNGVIFPFYDADTNMVYLCGKVRYFN